MQLYRHRFIAKCIRGCACVSCVFVYGLERDVSNAVVAVYTKRCPMECSYVYIYIYTLFCIHSTSSLVY